MSATTDPPATFYAPAGREGPAGIQRQHHVIRSVALLQPSLDAMDDAVVIVNGQRQVVNANRAMLAMLGCGLERVLGRRLGELVGCQNAACGPAGCGTAKACVTCGALEAILESQRNEDRITRECRISLRQPVAGALDLNVSAMAVFVDGERFSICVIKDISDQKRLSVLMRLFFHDVINTAGGIQGYTELIRERVPKDSPEDHELAELAELAEQLLEEIQAQRDLTYAESGELQPQ
jgi:hypothetical protein